MRLFRQGLKFPKGYAETVEGFLDQMAPEAGVKSGEDLFVADVGDRTGTLAVMRKDGARTSETLFIRPDRLEAYRKGEAEKEVVKAAAWGRSVEKDGSVKALLKYGLNGFEVEDSNMTPAQAKAFLEDKEERERIEAFMERQAKNDGVRKDVATGGWYRPTGFFSREDVEPVVTWSAGEKGVVWRSSPKH